jgi:predicted nucleic acid-binding Zn ribbon protein
LKIRKCVICQKRFKLKSSSQKTCSKECSHQLQLQKAAKYREKKRKPRPKVACEGCHKIFVQPRSDQRFCGSRCYNQHYKRTVFVEPRPCKECGEIFQPVNSRNILCSKECRYVHDKRRTYERGTIPRMPGTLKPKECVVCKRTYQPKAGSQRYCSPTCNGVVHFRRNRSRLDHNRTLICWICKTVFKPVTSKSRAKFCSAECRAVHHGNKAKEKQAELEQEAKKQVEVKEKWNDASVKSSELPADSMYPEEILAFIKRGGQITQYINPVWVEGSKPSEYE